MSPIDLASYDPMDPAVQQDPFESYAVLRREAPVFRHPKTGFYFVSRLDTVRSVLADTTNFSSRASSAPTPPSSAELARRLRGIVAEGWPPADTLLTADPPLHTRYRKLVGRTISPGRIRALEPTIRAIACDLIDRLPHAGAIDFSKGFAIPFPVRVISNALGVAAEREADVKRWSDDSVAALGARISDERRIEAVRGVVELQHYWANEIETRRSAPTNDIVSELVAAELLDKRDGGPGSPRPLEVPELLSIIQQLMVAGNETTTKLLNEIVKLLALHPEEWQRIRSEPDRIPLVVEEGLRLASPNQGLFRHVKAPVELEGVEIPAGATLWVMFGSANRDERFFPKPDRFDPDRPNLREHVAFGLGAHFCIGAPLARTETRIALEELARRLDTIRLPEGAPLHYEPSFILRGLSTLSIEARWAAAAA